MMLGRNYLPLAVILGATVLPTGLFAAGWCDHTAVKHWTLAATLAWFAVAPLTRGKPIETQESAA